jgi:hypothetical protein
MISWFKKTRLQKLQQQLARYEAQQEAELNHEERTGQIFSVVRFNLAGDIAATREKIRQLEGKDK